MAEGARLLAFFLSTSTSTSYLDKIGKVGGRGMILKEAFLLLTLQPLLPGAK